MFGSIGGFLSSAGGGAFGGGLFSGLGSAWSAYKAGKDAKEMQEAQIDWERERATHAHQWEMEDLKEAGLNPILAAGGSGAVTGGISTPMPDRSGYAQAGERFVNAAIAAIAQSNQNKATNAEIKQKDYQNSLTEAATLTEAYKQGLISQQTASTAMERNLKNAQVRALEQDIQQKADSFQLKLQEMQANIGNLKSQKRYKEAEAAIREYEEAHKAFTYWKNQVIDIVGALGQAKRDFLGTKTTNETRQMTEFYDSKGKSKGRKESRTISNMNKLSLGLSAARLISAML